MATAPKKPTPAHRRALLAALADDKGRVPESTNIRVQDAIWLAHWVTEVTNTGRAAAGARWAGYDGPTFLSINSSGRRVLLTDAGHTALHTPRQRDACQKAPRGRPRWPCTVTA
ncbi:hypothetical protein OG217_05090 [Streptomyces sp. NBC_01023]|uniref:hypothetical protein n=1 Tax=Streptomyces sp. NBC_01023 TaxID=2903724 RepID=UPI003863EF29|nr:hypothetical protein OG217_05090 [Streptomyces sp. NBC_01023]